MTTADLIKRYPQIEWRTPIEIVWPSGRMYACRVCIAEHGLDIGSPWQWQNRAGALIHIENAHGEMFEGQQ